MPKYSTLIGLGILIAVMPLLGFPLVVKDIFLVIIGLAIAVIAYFSNVQYCNNCRRIIEHGKHNAHTSQPSSSPVGEDVMKKNTTGFSN